jgi:hypothetical protein
MAKNLHVFRGIEPFLTLSSVRMSESEGNPVVEEPLGFEREDRQQQVFMDIFQALAEAEFLGFKRPWNKRLELVRGLH